MILPRGHALYERLNTSFTQIEPLLDQLKATCFSGYLQLVARDYEGLVLLEAGAVVNACEQLKDQRRNGANATDRILLKGRERDGSIGVFQLSAELARLLDYLFGRELLHKGLTSDLTSLDRLVAGLGARRHSGCIEVQFPASQDAATVFLRDGQVMETAWSCRDGFRAGPEALQDLIRVAASEGALFTIYSAHSTPQPAPPALPAEPRPQEQLGLWQDVLKTLEAGVDTAARPGVFLAAFRRACIELADPFPFLDPFAAEFDYRDGQIRYDGQESVATLHQGLSRCLAHCLRALAAQPGGRDVQGRLAGGVNGLKKRLGGRLAETGLAETLPELFGG
jgi:hypothetical protein